MQLVFVQSWPVAIDFPAVYRSAHDPHHVAVTVVGAPVAVFPRRSSEFGDHQDNGTTVDVAKAGSELRKAVPQRLQMIGKLAFGAALPDMRVPTAQAEESELNCRILPHQLA